MIEKRSDRMAILRIEGGDVCSQLPQWSDEPWGADHHQLARGQLFGAVRRTTIAEGICLSK